MHYRFLNNWQRVPIDLVDIIYSAKKDLKKQDDDQQTPVILIDTFSPLIHKS